MTAGGGEAMQSVVPNEELIEIRDKLMDETPDGKVKAWQIAEEVKKRHGTELNESTIRGRFIEMGQPLGKGGGDVKQNGEKVFAMPSSPRKEFELMSAVQRFEIPEELRPYIPRDEEFVCYIERGIDKRLALHYNLKKYPLTQGKQGTGKTYAHMYYAWKNQLPFFLYSCYEDFKLRKIFGDKTIKQGSLVFQESLFVKAIQSPSVILFDEINAISNANSFDFHALLQNRKLFVKDAKDGIGKLYSLHPECRIGFAQNPKSAKYIGGNIKPSNFLGRCTFITFPEFTKKELADAIQKRFPQILKGDIQNFVKFYSACTETIERSMLPLDVSIRQLINVIELWLNGLPLKESIEDGLSSMLEAVSQPAAKESFHKLAAAVWKELMK